MNDPRIHFAAERTLLAWIRTSLSIVILGFAVARFGLFLALDGGPAGGNARDASAWFGVALMGVGLVLNLSALARFRAFRKSLPGDQVSPAHGTGLAVFTALAMAAACAGLAVLIWPSGE